MAQQPGLDPSTPRWGSVAVGVDAAVRCGVVVVVVSLIREFWVESQDPFSEFPLTFAIPPLLAYLGWNLWVVLTVTLPWLSGAEMKWSMIPTLGKVSLARAVAVQWLAGDLWWQHRGSLSVLVAGSLLVTGLALVAVRKRTVLLRRAIGAGG